MTFGWVLAGAGLILVVFPQPLVAAARGWRLGMPDRETPGALHIARVGAVITLVAGLIIALA
jgi:hypothetical protein